MTMLSPPSDTDRATRDIACSNQEPSLRLGSRNRRKKQPFRPVIAAIALLYALALQANYVVLIAPVYDRFVYRYYPTDIATMLVPILIGLLPTAFLPNRLSRPSELALWLFYCVVVLPTSALALIATPLTLSETTTLVVAMNLSLMMLRFSSMAGEWIACPKIPRPSGASFLLILAGLSALNVLYLVSQVGFSFQLDRFFGDAHEGRLDVIDSLSGSGFGAYVLGWQSRAIGPILLIFSISAHKWRYTAFAAFTQLYMFSITTQRSALLVVVFIGCLAFLMDKKRIHRFGFVFSLGFLALPVIAGAGYYLTNFQGFEVANSFAVRRALMLPAILTGNYFDIFANAPVVNYAGSILSLGAESPYSEPVQRVAGSIIYRRPVHANINYLGNGYANLHWVGVGIETLIAAVSIAIFDVTSRGLDLRIRTLCFAVPAWMLTETAALTTALTHGLLLASCLALLAPRTRAWSAG